MARDHKVHKVHKDMKKCHGNILENLWNWQLRQLRPIPKNPLTVTLESKVMTSKCLHDLKTHLKMKKVVNFFTCRDLNN